MLRTPAQVAELLHVSASTIRAYTNDERLRQYLSPGATPGPGRARRLNDDDVQVLAYIASETKAGRTLLEILADVDAGEHHNAPQEPAEPFQQPTAALQVITVLQARVDAAESARDALHERIAELERENGKLAGELAALKEQQHKSVWARIFGR